MDSRPGAGAGVTIHRGWPRRAARLLARAARAAALRPARLSLV